MNKKKLTYGRYMAVLCAAMLASVIIALCLGSTPLTLGQVLQGLLRMDPASVETSILWVVRLPQVAGSALAGCALGIGGLLLQTATGNALAGPNVIGVNAGAGFAMVVGLWLAPMAYGLQPLFCIAGAFLTALVIVFVSDRVGGSKVTIVLAGVAVSALLNAAISALKLLNPDLALSYNAFSVGGVAGVQFESLALPAVLTLTVVVAAWLLSPRLDLLCLGDSVASSLGVRVRPLRTVALLLASTAAAAAVSFAGLLGFVGLMVPHMARALTGQGSLRRQIPLCALLGSLLVVLADLLGRVLFAPSQLPAGIITAVLGAPFFFVLLLHRRNRL